jgi:putative transposase
VRRPRVRDRGALLTFYEFPAKHWKPLRGTNPIDGTFATQRLRTVKTKGCLNRKTALTMVFKFCQSARKRWRRLDGPHRLAEIVKGVQCKDGEKLIERAA